MNMTAAGLVIGLATFLLIGICHPIVIKAEYHWTKKCWWAFVAIGLLFAALSLFLGDLLFPNAESGAFIVSSVCGAAAFSFFWGIHEVLSQEYRVLRGWFPENPAHHDYYERRRREVGIDAEMVRLNKEYRLGGIHAHVHLRKKPACPLPSQRTPV